VKKYIAQILKGAASTATAIGEGEGLIGVEETLAVPPKKRTESCKKAGVEKRL
jgi:hypothetical protein